MTDLVEFESPLGVVGTLVNRLLLTRYLEKLLHIRNDVIKRAAETGV